MKFPVSWKWRSDKVLGGWKSTQVLSAGAHSIGVCVFENGATVKKHKKRLELSGEEIRFLFMVLRRFEPNLYTIDEAKRKILMEEI